MLKPRSDGTGKDPRQASKLFDISESLKVGAIDKFPNFFWERNEAINGVINLPCVGNIFFFIVAGLVHNKNIGEIC